MNQIEKFDDLQEAMERVSWLVANSYKASIWWESADSWSGDGIVYCITSYSMI